METGCVKKNSLAIEKLEDLPHHPLMRDLLLTFFPLLDCGCFGFHLPDFSESGNSLAKNNWILPQKTVFWDLDSRLRRSAR